MIGVLIRRGETNTDTEERRQSEETGRNLRATTSSKDH